MQLFHRFLLAVLLLVCASVQARHYQASIHDASWRVSKTQMHCRLQQKIPNYGVAVFTNHAIYGYGFYLSTQRMELIKRFRPNSQLRSMPADWSADKTIKELSQVAVKMGKTPVRLGAKISVALLDELEKGRFPTFYFKDMSGLNNNFSVALSSVNFNPALKKFVSCATRMARFRFSYIRKKTVYFDSGNDKISPYFAKRLDEVAAYIIHNQNIRQVRLDGHTDILGTYRFNLSLSKRRTEAIKRYLLQRRVPASLIKIRYFGALSPAVSNRDASGRRKNRRVNIRLYKY